MNIKILSKIVNAVVTWSLHYNDSHTLDKISTVNYKPCASTVSTLHNCVYINGDFVDIVVSLLNDNIIDIYRVKRENHLCVGYELMYCIYIDKKHKLKLPLK